MVLGHAPPNYTPTARVAPEDTRRVLRRAPQAPGGGNRIVWRSAAPVRLTSVIVSDQHTSESSIPKHLPDRIRGTQGRSRFNNDACFRASSTEFGPQYYFSGADDLNESPSGFLPSVAPYNTRRSNDARRRYDSDLATRCVSRHGAQPYGIPCECANAVRFPIEDRDGRKDLNPGPKSLIGPSHPHVDGTFP